MTHAFQQTMRAECGTEAMKLMPSPYIKHDAYILTESKRGQELVLAFGGQRTGSDMLVPAYHLTPKRAEKCARLFEAGFSAVLVRETWMFRRGVGKPMELSHALHAVEAMR